MGRVDAGITSYNEALHDFAGTLERLALLLGGSTVDGALAAITPAGVVVAIAIVLVIRPVAGMAAWSARTTTTGPVA